MVLKVGVHPNNLHLQIAALEWADAGLAGVEFVHYPEGRDTARWLQAGDIDVGGTGSTPALIAQAEGTAVVYLAASAPRAANGALVARAASGILLPAALQGKRIALIDGSFHTSFLAAVLEQAGLGLADVERVERSPREAYAEIQGGAVDAWVAMAPWLDRIKAEAGWRQIASIADFLPNRSVFWTVQTAYQHKREALRGFFTDLASLGQRIQNQPGHYAELLAQAGIGGFDAAGWRASLAQRDWSLVDTNQTVAAEQQQEADLLWRHRALPRPIAIAEALPSL
jgi:sulfonate transport system substrate-binding protein